MLQLRVEEELRGKSLGRQAGDHQTQLWNNFSKGRDYDKCHQLRNDEGRLNINTFGKREVIGDSREISFRNINGRCHNQI